MSIWYAFRVPYRTTSKGFVLLPIKHKTNTKINQMIASTKPSSLQAKNGNKSKPVLGDDLLATTKFNHNDRVFHALFGWCKIRMISEKSAVIDCEAKTITYYIIAKGLKHYERDENGCQIVCVPVEELFSTKEEVPKIYGLQATAMSLKLTYDE